MSKVRFSTFTLVAMTAAMFVLTGCAGNPGPVVRSNFVEFTPEQLQQIDADKQYEYQLQTGDLLKIAFADEKTLSSDPVRILPDGTVTLVGLDRVKLAGMTVTEADSTLTAAYSRQFRDPRISVIVLESSGRQVYVLGEVRNPGLVKLPQGGLGPIAAVTLAGGFSDDAAKGSSVLVRVTPTGYLVQELNLSDFHSITSSSLATVQLMPFDVVYVPRSKIGDFGYFAKSILAGLVQITRIASDVKYISGNTGRY